MLLQDTLILKYASLLVGLIYMLLVFNPTKTGYYLYDKTSEMDSVVWFTIITIFFSIYVAYHEWHQAPIGTFFNCIRLTYGLFLYFLLKRWNVSQEKLIKYLTAVCLIWVFLEIFQQLTYPYYAFSGRSANGAEIENRMGMWRFYIFGVDFVMLVYAYWYGNVIRGNNIKDRRKNILLTFTFLIGLLLYLSRKHMAVSLLVILLSFFNVSRKKKALFLIVLLLFALILATFFLDSFIQMNDDAASNQGGDGEKFIRYRAALFFLDEVSDSPMYPIWGLGLEGGGEGPLWDYVQYFQDTYFFYQADTGIIGYYSKFGLIGISAILWYVVKFLYNWKYIDNWFKYFFIMKILLVFFDFWAMWGVGMFAYGLFLYMLDKNIIENKKRNKLKLALKKQRKIFCYA